MYRNGERETLVSVSTRDPIDSPREGWNRLKVERNRKHSKRMLVLSVRSVAIAYCIDEILLNTSQYLLILLQREKKRRERNHKGDILKCGDLGKIAYGVMCPNDLSMC